jgi:hypothetical protein
VNKIVSLSAIAFAVFIVIVDFSSPIKWLKIPENPFISWIMVSGFGQADRCFTQQTRWIQSPDRTLHRLFFTLAPDDAYIKDNIQKSLYLIDDSGKKEYTNLREKAFIIRSLLQVRW